MRRMLLLCGETTPLTLRVRLLKASEQADDWYDFLGSEPWGSSTAEYYVSKDERLPQAACA